MRGGLLSLAAATALVLSACGRSEREVAPGDVTVSEAKALDEAAEMIEARQPPPAVVSATPAPVPPPPSPSPSPK